MLEIFRQIKDNFFLYIISLSYIININGCKVYNNENNFNLLLSIFLWLFLYYISLLENPKYIFNILQRNYPTSRQFHATMKHKCGQQPHFQDGCLLNSILKVGHAPDHNWHSCLFNCPILVFFYWLIYLKSKCNTKFYI